MYDVIYDEMVDAGVSVALSSPIYTDMEGNQVLDESLRVGLKQEIMITKPSYILFADESDF